MLTRPLLLAFACGLSQSETVVAQQFGEIELLNIAAPGRPGPLITDVDGDGLLDLLFSSEAIIGFGNDLVWQRAVAPGVYAEATPLIDVAGGVSWPALVDVDFDGDEDLVAHVSSVGVAVFERTGAGFSPEPTATRPIGNVPIRAAVGDVDGDGAQDFLAETTFGLMGGSVVTVYRGDGLGSFGPPEVVASIPPTDFLRLRSAQDIDGDGDDDIIFNRRDDEVAVMRWSGAAGFGPVEILDPASGQFVSSLAADVNGDGLVDLLFGSFSAPGSVSVLPGEPGGGFGQVTSIMLPVSAAAARFLTGDLDGDGLEDIIIRTEENLLWLRQVGPGVFSAAAPATLAPVTGGLAKVALGDVDADGDLDAVLEMEFGPGARAVGLLPGNGVAANAPFGDPIQLSAARENELVHAIGDLNGDGVNEIVGLQRFAETRPVAFNFQSEGTIAGAPTPRFSRSSLGSLSQSDVDFVRLGDLNSDGLDDLVLSASGSLVYVPSEPGLELGVPVTVGPIDRGVRPELEDVDLDGRLDLVASDGDQRSIVWFQNLGGDAFGPEQLLQPAQNPLTHIRFADLDGDGQRDLVFAEEQTLPGPTTGRVAWSPRQGAIFGPRRTLSTGAQTDATALAIADLDGNGLLDVVWGTQNTTNAFWARNLGGGSFTGTLFLREVGNNCEEIEAVDLDLDGRDDLVFRLRRSIRYSLNAGAASFPVLTQLRASTTWMSFGDVDMDGDTDLVSSTEFNSEIGFHSNAAIETVGSSLCGPAVQNASGASGQIFGTGSASVSGGEMGLLATGLPQQSFGYFLASDVAAITFPVPASVGRLCLGGSIGRYVGPGQILNSGAAGQFALAIDLTALPTPTGPVAATPGETYYFQAWFRDVTLAGSATSNFTDAVEVMWL